VGAQPAVVLLDLPDDGGPEPVDDQRDEVHGAHRAGLASDAGRVPAWPDGGEGMASWDDVRRLALDLPEVVEERGGTTTSWRIGSKAFAWERVLRRGERETLGDAAPPGPALGLRTADPGVVDALVASRPGVYFTVAGYGIHPMVLLHVERASFEDLDEALTEAWLCRAPARLRKAFLAGA
jgi:hypothetical protein